jgi:hypothetical protein
MHDEPSAVSQNKKLGAESLELTERVAEGLSFCNSL